jgi:hypothetical protein
MTGKTEIMATKDDLIDATIQDAVHSVNGAQSQINLMNHRH